MKVEDFIRARLDETEKAARRAAKFRYDQPTDAPWISMKLKVERGLALTSDAHFALHDPDTVLRDIAGKRKILEECERLDTGDHWWLSGPLIEIICALASPWATHPDYETWWGE